MKKKKKKLKFEFIDFWSKLETYDKNNYAKVEYVTRHIYVTLHLVLHKNDDYFFIIQVTQIEIKDGYIIITCIINE